MKYEDPFDPKSLLPSRIRETPAWRDFANGIQKVFAENIVDAREYLLRSRDPLKFRRGQFFRINNRLYRIESIKHNNSSYPFEPLPESLILADGEGSYYEVSGINATNERYLLIRNAQELGFNIIAERLNDEDFSRLCETLGEYYHQKGAKAFIDYIGYIKNVDLKITQMWAEENPSSPYYTNLSPEPQGTTVIDDPENGTWYPTSHYRVEYDGSIFDDFASSEFLELFLKFAPIHIVLESFSAVFYAPEMTLFMTMTASHEKEVIHSPANDPDVIYMATIWMNLSSVGDTEIFHSPVNE